jgi:CxxC-x17-CxxC domain-containing protein
MLPGATPMSQDAVLNVAVLGRASSEGSRDSSGSAREMHPAVCAQCGRDTMVPFVPRGDKPVYCSDCFSSMRSSSYR